MTTIREFQSFDILEFVRLYQKIFPSKKITQQKIKAVIKNDPAKIFLIQNEDSQFIGFLYFWVVLDEYRIIDIGIEETFRKRGLASRLVQTLINRAMKDHISLITLDVRADNSAAMGLYQKMGFKAVGLREKYYRDGCDGVLMDLTISESTKS